MPNYYQKLMSEWKLMRMQGFDGKGVKVANIDSGNNNAPDVSVNFTTDPMPDVFGHGSQVASIIKGQIGMANGCTLYNLKWVTDVGGTGTEAKLIEALQYCIDNNIDFVNVSLSVFETTEITAKLNECRAAGVIVIAASGNSSTVANTFYPARLENVIAVNTVKEDGTLHYLSYLPAGTIDIACNGYQNEVVDKNGTLTQISAGTSFSSPFFTAMCAVEKQRLGLTGMANNIKVVDHLKAKAIKQTNTAAFGAGIATF